MLYDFLSYRDGGLHADSLAIEEIAAEVGTPVYIYSLRRALDNLDRVRSAFGRLNAEIHYSAKANANLSVLRHLIDAGAGIDAVSGGEIHRALLAGADPQSIVFAGVGKTEAELVYALDQRIAWFNVENVGELLLLNHLAGQRNVKAQVALRLNPEITADTHPHIATGHGGAKFGLTAEVVADLLARQADFPHIQFAGIHIHIGSQLRKIAESLAAVQAALELIEPYPQLRSINIGGGLPVAYLENDPQADYAAFAEALYPLLKDYRILLEPGRSIIADAGLLISSVLYVKEQAGQRFVITDASMTELIRPALYQAAHTIQPLHDPGDEAGSPVQIVGPVCETTDVLGRDVLLPDLAPGDTLAILTTGAYGMVMASNYNQRPRPPEVVILPDGRRWQLARRRETWDDLVATEISP